MMNNYELDEEYIKALKKGRRQVFKDRLKKQEKHLKVLDELEGIDRLYHMPLGVIDVPSSLIVGTKTYLRSLCFSSDYMPLLKRNSEFALKWKKVCEYHMSDIGISDPPLVYEYLGKFYVAEGNKRISVLKYFGAILIPCEVIRIVPEPINDKEINIYNEFLYYYEYSKLYTIQFKKTGYYDKLVRLMGLEYGYTWSKTDRYKLIGIYERVSELLKHNKLNVYAPDALIVMMEIYGYNNLIEMSNKEIGEGIQLNRNKIIYNKAHFNILCVSDEENRVIWDGYHRDLKDIDFIISCGDLKATYLEYLVTVSNRDLLYVHGNHDQSYDNYPPEGCIDIDDKIIEYKGLRILGLGGSYRYNDSSKYMYTEKEMAKRIKKLKRKIDKLGGVDIIVTHAPIRGYGDLQDLPHLGFECFEKLVNKYHPHYFLFGHVHKNYQYNYIGVYQIGDTQVINVCDKEKIVI